MTISLSNRSDEPADPLAGALAHMEELGIQAAKDRRDLEAFAAGQPQTVACNVHPHVIRHINLNLSSAVTHQARLAGAEGFTLVYDPCPECRRDRATSKKSSWLQSAGCPPILCHATFDTFCIENDQDRNALGMAHKFAADGKGFLFMTGALGDGKSFLAVAILRAVGKGMFMTHNDLLFKLRRGYGDRDAEDVLERAIEAKLFVLDDVGLSTGGRDDIPMLHHVLSNRHDAQMPTVVTSNLTLPDVYRTLGDRMAQRFAQSQYAHVAFSGPSHRQRERANYLKQ